MQNDMQKIKSYGPEYFSRGSKISVCLKFSNFTLENYIRGL